MDALLTPHDVLDCGHPKPETPDSGGIGVAYSQDGRSHCYACADVLERDAFQSERNYFAYLSSDAQRVTTWTGGTLAYVTRVRKETRWTPSGGHYVRYHVWAWDGKRRWYGTGPGEGMYVRLRRTK